MVANFFPLLSINGYSKFPGIYLIIGINTFLLRQKIVLKKPNSIIQTAREVKPLFVGNNDIYYSALIVRSKFQL